MRTPEPTQVTPEIEPEPEPTSSTLEQSPATSIADEPQRFEPALEDEEGPQQEFKEMDHLVAEPVFDPMKELNTLGHTELTVQTLLDERTIPIFTKMLKESNLKDQPPSVIKEMVMMKFKGNPIGKVFSHCEKCLNIFVEVLRDKQALPAIIAVFARKKDLKKYGMIWLGLLIFFFFIKHWLIPSEWRFYQRLPLSMAFSLGFTVLSFFIFYSMFKKEVGPTVDVLWRNL